MSPRIDRRAWLKTAGAAVLGAGLGSRCAAPVTETPRFFESARLAGSDHPNDGRLASISPLGLRAQVGAGRRQDGHPQLRPRRERHVVFLGHRPPGGGRSVEHRRNSLCGDRRRRRGAFDRPAPSATRVRGDGGHEGPAATYDNQHVGGVVRTDERLGARPHYAGVHRDLAQSDATLTSVLSGLSWRRVRRALVAALLVFRESARPGGSAARAGATDQLSAIGGDDGGPRRN